MEENNELINNPAVEYTDDNIRHLSDMEHVRTRPGMYIGKLGDGSHAEDGIYVLLKEIIDNSIDEFKMQAGKKIEIIIEENLRVSVRDYDTQAKWIILYYQGKNLTEKAILEQAKAKLPNYMWPNKFIPIKRMPYKANGKIDRKALKAMYAGG